MVRFTTEVIERVEGRTHMIGGAVAAAAAVSYFIPGVSWPEFVVALGCGAIAGELADIDKAHTWASTWAPVLPLIHSRLLLTSEAAVAALLWTGSYLQYGGVHPGWPLAATVVFAAHLVAHLATKRLLQHRGITHCIWVVLALALGLRQTGAPYWLLISVIAGYCSHLIPLDALTPDGIQILWPIPLRFSLTGWLPRWARGPFVTGGPVERFLVRPALVTGLAAALLFRLQPGLFDSLFAKLGG